VWRNEHSHSQVNSHFGNCQFDSQPPKLGNRPNLLMCRWCAAYYWKVLNKGYNFALDFTSIKGLHKKLWREISVNIWIAHGQQIFYWHQRVKAINKLKRCVSSDYIKCCAVSIQNHVHVLIPISVILIHQLNKQWTNDFVGGFCLSITLWIISGQGYMS
jgi:hypothetical protein